MATSREIAAKYTFKENDADTDAMREARAEFFDFHAAFMRARPTRVARKQLDLSTAHPAHFLNITKRPFIKETAAVVALPPDLKTLVNAQEKSGIWRPTPDVMRVLEGNVGATPAPPEGVSDWRWTTVLCVVYMQRQPEHFVGMQRAFERAARWNEDLHLRQRARRSLPPLPAYYFIDPDAIKSGTWKESTDKMMDEKGYDSCVRGKTSSVREADRATRACASRYVAFTNTIRDQVLARINMADDGPLTSRSSVFTASTTRRRSRGSTRSVPASVRRNRRVSHASHVSGMSGKSGSGGRVSTLTPKQQAALDKHSSMLQTEWLKAAETSSSLLEREEVRCFWRRASRWGNPEYTTTPHKAQVTRTYADGSADVAFKDGARETLHRVHRRCVVRRSCVLNEHTPTPSPGMSGHPWRCGTSRGRYISRAGEPGFELPGGEKPRYLKGR